MAFNSEFGRETLAIIQVDIESAYDSILRKYVFDVLHRLGFGHNFLYMLGTLYSRIEAQTLFGGVNIEPFVMTNGLGQGDPLSPLLFAVAMLPLSLAISKQCSAFSSHLHPGGDVSASPPPQECYADDVIACIRYNSENIREYMGIFEDFGQMANLTIERAKSLVAISKVLIDDEKEELTNIGFSNDRIIEEGGRFIFLGKEIHMGAEQDNNSFLQEKLDKIKKTIKIWHKKYLGYRGRQIISNTFLNSQLQHLLYNMKFSEAMKNKFESTILEFLNKKKISCKDELFRWRNWCTQFCGKN